ncbi:hypothetical protein LIER_09152 [Lithospermum erythrorhizon]|uniref:Uncharacterized protein n=1 Tax=Lithospermum erythrorhizon TaxID=34254 RepID=A0AAV3PEP2_LITER
MKIKTTQADSSTEKMADEEKKKSQEARASSIEGLVREDGRLVWLDKEEKEARKPQRQEKGPEAPEELEGDDDEHEEVLRSSSGGWFIFQSDTQASFQAQLDRLHQDHVELKVTFERGHVELRVTVQKNHEEKMS